MKISIQVAFKKTLTFLTLFFALLNMITQILLHVPTRSFIIIAYAYSFSSILCCVCSFLCIFFWVVGDVVFSRKRVVNRVVLSAIVLFLYMLITLLREILYGYDETFRLQDLIGWPMLFIQFYYVALECDFKKQLSVVFRIFMILLCFASYLALDAIIIEFDDGTAKFATYFVIAFLPLLLYFLKHEFEKIVFLGIAMGVVLMSGKRAGFLALACGFLMYMSITYLFDIKKLKTVVKIMVGIIVLCLLINVFFSSDLDLVERLSKISSDGGSGRSTIWGIIIDAYGKSSVFEKIFGHGLYGVKYLLNSGSTFAHNSYLEYLYDYGVVGLVCLLNFVLVLFKRFLIMLKQKSPNTAVYGFSLVISLFFSLLSYFFEQYVIIIPIVIFWGICIGTEDRRKLEKHICEIE